MIGIDRRWWEHLAPTPMHKLRGEVERLLRNWCKTGYGAHWLSSASRESGLIRVKPGQTIPNFHVVAMRGGPIFVGPQGKVRLGHRGVGADELQSGHPLEEGELALQPTIRLDLVTDQAMIGAARRRNLDLRSSAVSEPSTIFSAPAHLLLSPKGWPKKSFVLYQHIFGDGVSYPDDGYFYVGVTTRSWQTRWSEHQRAMRNGSPLLFHRTLRKELHEKRVTYIHHKVMGVTTDVDVLYDMEELLVEGHWRDKRRLNMIPGGKSGLRYLREHGLVEPALAVAPDDREQHVARWLAREPRRGLPAPWVSDRWKDHTWAVAQICGRPGRLSVDQVQAIRRMASQHEPAAIAVKVGARNTEQVRRVLRGRTYSRVR